MINFISHHFVLFSIIFVLFIGCVIIIAYEIKRAIRVPDDYEEEQLTANNRF